MVRLHIGFFALLLSSPRRKNNLVLQLQERPHPLVALGSTPRQTEFQLAAEMSSNPTARRSSYSSLFLFFENLGGKFVSPFD